MYKKNLIQFIPEKNIDLYFAIFLQASAVSLVRRSDKTQFYKIVPFIKNIVDWKWWVHFWKHCIHVLWLSVFLNIYRNWNRTRGVSGNFKTYLQWICRWKQKEWGTKTSCVSSRKIEGGAVLTSHHHILWESG